MRRSAPWGEQKIMCAALRNDAKSGPHEVAVAIVGLGGAFPDAPDVATFWQNICRGHVAIRDVPQERWDPRAYYASERSAPDKTYSRIGGFLAPTAFDARRFRIPPKTVAAIDDVQKLALTAVAEALADAGLEVMPQAGDGRVFDRERTAVILGNSMGGEAEDRTSLRCWYPAAQRAIEESEVFKRLDASQRAEMLAEVEVRYKQALPEVTEDSMPGELSNCIAGRIANIFNLRGANFTTDAACAASMAALQAAVDGLTLGHFDLAIAGGADRSMDPPTYVKFSKIGALSAEISAPFDARASGFVMGEGVGILVLKRLADAQRDGDRIYAVVRGIGAASDGKGKGMTAPNPQGQRLAIERAYAAAGFGLDSVGLIEAHGTATVVGDATEARVLTDLLKETGAAARGLPIGSVKSMIGHLKSAAGAASLIKTALALHHKQLPPSASFERAPEGSPLGEGYLRVNTALRSWESAAMPRRAGVSAFGFGGTNFHIILEEAQTASVAQPRRSLPVEPRVVVVHGATVKEAVAAGQATLARSEQLEDLVAVAPVASSSLSARVGFVAQSLDDARKKLADAATRRPRVLATQGIFVSEGEPLAQRGKVAFLFPGQGSQYIGMLRDLADRFPVVASTFAEADAVLQPLIGESLSALAWPSVTGDDQVQRAELRLRQTEFCQPAMLAADVAMFRLFAQYGIHPDMVAGHSLGEYAACVAAGVLSFADALYAVSARGREMASVKVEDPGKMASVAGPLEKIESVIASIDGYVIAANKNCHAQTVIAGGSRAVELAVQRFAEQGIEAREIPVSHAFHSAIVAPASAPLRRVLAGLGVRAPQVPILSNVDADYYPAGADAIVDTLARQLESPVEFIAQIERMYADGARVFVEVGPRRAITGFVRNVLGEREHRALASNHPKRPGYDGLLEVLAALAVDGVVSSSAPRSRAVAVVAKQPAVQVADAFVVSGVAVALPTPQPMAGLDEDAFAPLVDGHNFIQPVDATTQQEILHKNVVRLDKASGGFEPLREVADVIQLAARLGHIDLVRDYGVESSLDDALDATGRMAIGVGIDALRDAGLPLVRRYRTTSTGKQLPDGWALPPLLGKTMGVVFASAFPGVDRLVEDLSAHLAARHAGESAASIERLVDELASTLADHAEAGRVREMARRHVDRLRDEAGLYAFSRKFLFRVLAMGHAQLAQLIGAQGPNTHVKAACASGPLAIGIARDWLQLGRCERVLVVTADNVTSPTLLPYFAAGFLSAGAATVERELGRAAVPFGAERNGMILGAGASAFVIERDAAVTARGMQPIVDILATHYSNSAFHGTRLDTASISEALEQVLCTLEQATARSRTDIARSSLFVSHETYTPARGGSSAAEVEALRRCFGDAARDVIIANTKGYTGHPMGATLEDVVAIKALQRGQVPAVANLDPARRNVDPAFADLRFSAGEAFSGDLAIRFSAGFGSQIAITAFRQRARGEARLAEPHRYEQWLTELTGRPQAGLEIVARTLRVAEHGGRPPWELGVPSLMQPTVTAVLEPETAQAPGRSLDRTAVLLEVQELFAQATGYETTELDPSYDLEADLGIDTVKQAEVLGIIRARYALGRDESFRLGDVQTLDAVVAYVLGRTGTGTLGADTATPVAVEAAPLELVANAVDPTDDAPLLEELTRMFAQATGYELGDLEPTYELEADLGIDTVKQAEIFGLIRERYAMPKDETFRLSDVQTLAAVARYVTAQRRTASVAASTAPSPTPVTSDAEAHASNVRVWAVGPVPAAPLSPSSRTFVGRHVLVVYEERVDAAAMVAALARRGATTTTLRLEGAPGDSATVERRAQAFLPTPDDVIVLCAPDGDARSLGDRVLHVFALARELVRVREGDMAGAGWMVMGRGTGKLHDQLTLMTLAGLGKSLAKEWEGARCVTVDVAVSFSEAEAAERAIIEYLGDGPLEVGVDRARRVTLRRTHLVETVPSSNTARVVVATGGARGVTYRVLRELAERGSRRFVVLGRTAPAAPATSPIVGLDDESQRKRARERLEAQGERATPAAVGRWLAHARAELEVHANLETLRTLGSDVEFERCDVADADELEAVLAAIGQRVGAVDLVVHGAGHEASKWITDKDDEAFAATWAPKAQAAIMLLAHLRPKRLVTMGSVAGRFGNAGQTDYAMANALLAALSQVDGRVLNIGWTAWDEVGMATRGSVRQVLEAYGVELLPAALGARLGADLALSVIAGDVVVAGDLGVFESTEPPAGTAGVTHWSHEFFDTCEQLEGKEVYRWRLDLARHPGLGDHRIDGTPVLPGVLGIELMVQAAADATGSRPLRLTGVEFRSPLKLHRDEAVDAAIELERAEGGMRATLVSSFAGPAGRRLRREHFSALIHFDRSSSLTPPGSMDGTPTPPLVTRDDLYARYFHGPLFRVLADVTNRRTDAMQARPIESQPAWLVGQTTRPLVSLPYLREAGFQLAGLWEMMELGRMALPAGIEELHLLADTDVGADVCVTARNLRVGDSGCTFDVWGAEGGGKVVDVMRGYRTVVLRPLAPNERFVSTDAAGEFEKVELAEVRAQLDRQGETWLDSLLSTRERAHYARLKTDKRRMDWLAGRLAAKRLVIRVVTGRDGVTLAPPDISVVPDPQGAPTVEIVGTDTVHLSLTHADGVAFAFASPSANVRPGIDVEKVKERDAGFARDFFTAVEQDEAQADEYPAASLTCRWAVKEAVLKALGIGARVDMRDIVVTHSDGGEWQVELRGEALQVASALEAGSPDVRVQMMDGRAVARVLLPTGTQSRAAHGRRSAAEVLA
ncbi:MAG: SDR family NAD(P)-dependent oxidoreductase [Myxococcota bacterium]